jgi:hypothetical protein
MSNAVSESKSTGDLVRPQQEKSMPGISVTTLPGGARALELVGNSSSNVYQSLGGSEVHAFNLQLLKRVMSCTKTASDEELLSVAESTAASLEAFKPTDEIEGMMAAQAIALHHSSMECFRRAMLPGQLAEVASKLRKDGANTARAMTEMIDALDRKRGKGPQVVRVERVTVHEGGQAIVGNVQHGGGAVR